ncbi:helix-turn-helix domain-containing protein [Buttiauxella izardii]|uniref:Cyclic nucleotide-binding protein n=1 Tax=Buttiauxella izardii TaxID=82991 RepID=A0A3A5JY78_9ENTR|nr:helix-turn-helix domain-containing protein [Buttiauxella izardii]RJT27976.1 cyclic nucleotide-binding protein [Buttiauxella izardii]
MDLLEKAIVSDRYISSDDKPSAHIDILIDAFKPHAKIFETKARQTINYIEDGESRIVLLLRGSICLYRKSDNIVLNSESSRYIFGISQQLTTPHSLFLRTQETSLVGTLPLNIALELIRTNKYWESLARLLIYNVTRVHDHCAKISQLSSYDILRSQLFELMNESPEIRSNTTAANYIISRTFLSRSCAMRILSALKAGNYITMEKGILIDVHHLPLKY